MRADGFEAGAVVAALNRVLSAEVNPRPLSLHEPRFAGREWDYVKDCLDTGWVSSVGAYVDRFEAMLAERCGAARAVAVVNGTAALHVALVLAGVQPGDEVIAPSLTFIATINAISYCSAVPHFADSARDGFGLDPEALDLYLGQIAEIRPEGTINRRTGRPIRALLPMHVFGLPAAMDRLAEVAARWGLALVEDAAEGLGVVWRGRPLGSFAPIGTLSFNGNKVVTTGGGGALLFADAELGKRAKHLTSTAKVPHAWSFEHDEIGFNYRLPNLNAALGCAQLEQLDAFLESKRALTALYAEIFAGVDGVEPVVPPQDGNGTVWLNSILVPDRAARDAVLARCHEAGLLVRPAWTLMHRLAVYAGCPRAPVPVAEELEDRLVCLPSGPGLRPSPRPNSP